MSWSFSCASKASTVDNQGIGRTATGSHDVRLTTNKNHSIMTNIIQQATSISLHYDKHDPLTSTAQQASPRQPDALEEKSSKQQLYLFSLHGACISTLNVATWWSRYRHTVKRVAWTTHFNHAPKQLHGKRVGGRAQLLNYDPSL